MNDKQHREVEDLSFDDVITCLVGAATVYADSKSDISGTELKRYIAELNKRYAQARTDTIDQIFKLSPKAKFKDWKPKDALQFYERLQDYEQQLKPNQADGEDV